MIPELGQFALIVALCIALAQAILPLAGAARGNVAWMHVARPAAQGQFVFVAIAFGCLAYSFVNNDFSVLNVATNSNSSLPWYYRFAATWGSHEGSLLLWVLMLGVWTRRGERFQPPPAARNGGAHPRRDGADFDRLPAVHAAHVESVRAPAAAARRRPRPESAAAGSRHGDPSADAVHGLRRVFGGVCLCHRRAARRQGSTPPGRAGRVPGPRWPGCF